MASISLVFDSRRIRSEISAATGIEELSSKISNSLFSEQFRNGLDDSET